MPESHSFGVVVEDEPSSVDHLEHERVATVVRVLCVPVQAVPRRPGRIERDRAVHVGNVANPVDQRRLPDVGPSDDRDEGLLHGLLRELLAERVPSSHAGELDGRETWENPLVVKDPALPVWKPQIDACVVVSPVDGLHHGESLPLPQDLPGAGAVYVWHGADRDALGGDHVRPLFDFLRVQDGLPLAEAFCEPLAGKDVHSLQVVLLVGGDGLPPALFDLEIVVQHAQLVYLQRIVSR
mmetsp:Transcript_90276/g.244713  ORF Transcript_90276/g.244713 Transcript_90276/m.244713 type:complete len:239 (-) Transcript_90276:65-781(-)